MRRRRWAGPNHRRAAVRHSLTDDRFRKSQPYALLDLKAPESASRRFPPVIRQTATDEDEVIDWSLEEVTPEYFGEINDRRTRELGIKEKYVRKSLQFLISESVKKIAKYDSQLRQIRDENDPKRLSLQGNRAQEEARTHRAFPAAQGSAGRDRAGAALSEKPPEVMGVAVILPPPQGRSSLRSRAWKAIPRSSASPSSSSRSTRSSQGRKPVSVEEENCGWDVTSLLDGQVDRYIEVKGRAGVGGVALTPNEWIKAQRFGERTTGSTS